MKETKPTTKRLRELKQKVEDYQYPENTRLKLEGYNMALEDLWPVVEAARVAHIQLNEAIEFLEDGIGYENTPLVSKVLASDFMISALALRDALAAVEFTDA